MVNCYIDKLIQTLKEIFLLEELLQSLAAICGEEGAATGHDPADHPRFDDAVAMLALCGGGLSLARAVGDPDLSDRILEASRAAAERLGPRHLRGAVAQHDQL